MTLKILNPRAALSKGASYAAIRSLGYIETRDRVLGGGVCILYNAVFRNHRVVCVGGEAWEYQAREKHERT